MLLRYYYAELTIQKKCAKIIEIILITLNDITVKYAGE